MSARLAKKVMREFVHGPCPVRHRETTMRRAQVRNWKSRKQRLGCGRTPGWRWGRWDPCQSLDPRELPF